MFTEARLRLLAGEFGAEWMELGVHLGIKTSEIDRFVLFGIFCFLFFQF